MSYQQHKIVSFGSSKAGLSTVGYQLFDTAGTAVGSHITAGVIELAGGQYMALVTFPDAHRGILEWDTGGGSPVYAAEEINPEQAENTDVKTSTLPTLLLDLAAGVETALTLRQALRLLVAAEAGKLSGAATTTILIRNYGDSKDRITATCDSVGNRTAVSYDLS